MWTLLGVKQSKPLTNKVVRLPNKFMDICDYNKRKRLNNGEQYSFSTYWWLNLDTYIIRIYNHFNPLLSSPNSAHFFFGSKKYNISLFEFVGCTVSFWLQPPVADKASAKLGLIKEGSTYLCQRYERRFFKVRWAC